jgi:hypothetical protein
LIGRYIFGDSKFLIKRKRGVLIFFHMAPKGAPKFTSPTKPPKISTMTEEEREEIFHQMEQLEKENENRE